MALIVSLKDFFSVSPIPVDHMFSLTNTTHGIHIDGGDCLVYGDVKPFNRRVKHDYLRFLGEKNISGEFDHSDSGEYAIACLNRKTRTIALSKDFSGSRNLYYAVEGGRLILSTNVYDVLAQLEIRKFDAGACLEFLMFEYIGAPRTLFSGIQSLRHGATVLLDTNGTVVREIASPALSDIEEHLPDNWARNLREKIVTAHQRRLGARNGIYLSGGIDSSVMAITLKNDLGIDDLVAVTFSTKGAEHDESGHAVQAAKELGIGLEKVVVDPERPIDLPGLLEHSSFPYVGSLILSSVGEHLKIRGLSDINLYAGQDSRVLTPPYNPIDNLVLNRLADFRTARNASASIAWLLRGFHNRGKVGKGLERLAHAEDDLSLYVARYFLHFHRRSENAKGGEFASLWKRLNDQICAKLATTRGALSIANAIFDITWDRQHWSDMDYMIKNTEAFGGSASMPFFDRDFAFFSAALPMSLKMQLTLGRAGHSGKTKVVNKFALREAYKGELSDQLVYRDKAVCITNHLYLNGSLSPYVREYFSRPRLGEIGLVDALDLRGLIQRALARDGSWTMTDYDEVVEVHNLLYLEAIARKFNVIA